MLKINKIGASVTEVIGTDRIVLFSYNTPVAAWIDGSGYFKTEKQYSRTTSKHITQWTKSRGAYDGVILPTRPQSFFDGLI